VLRIARTLGDKLAEDVVILDMRGVVSFCDWFVIASGRNSRHTRSLADEVRSRLKAEDGTVAARVEGQREGDWILIDYIDVVVHIFTPESRSYYHLEQLWGQVPVVEMTAETA
jgi:ribosome-associated protein